jgi:Polyketide cyclase / dehydrase and lipid transport
VIRASPERVFAHIAHPEHLPRYAAPLWMSADLGEKRGGVQIVSLRGYFAGLPVESVQRVVVRPPSSAEFSQIYGTLRALSGRYTLRSAEDGTEVVCRLEADPGIPMISDETAQQFLRQFLERMLDRLKLAAERKAPARPRPRAPLSELAVAGVEAEEEEVPSPPLPPGPEAVVAMPAPPSPPAPPGAAPSPTAAGAPTVQRQSRDRSPGGAPQAVSPGQPPSGRRRRRRRHRRGRGGSSGAAPPSAPPSR